MAVFRARRKRGKRKGKAQPAEVPNYFKRILANMDKKPRRRR